MAQETPAQQIVKAASEGRLSKVQALLKSNSSLANALGSYTREISGQTITFFAPVLHFAIRGGHLDVVKALLAAKADVNGKNNFGTTALQAALVFKKSEIARYLIEHGANVNFVVEKGKSAGTTALSMATQNGDAGIVKLLIQKGAKVNTKDQNGITPLHLAAYFGYVETARILLNAGAEINARDNAGNTPMKIAQVRKNMEVYALLKDKGGVVK